MNLRIDGAPRTSASFETYWKFLTCFAGGVYVGFLAGHNEWFDLLGSLLVAAILFGVVVWTGQGD